MRRATFRDGDDRDYGFPAHRPRDEIRAAHAAVTAAVRTLIGEWSVRRRLRNHQSRSGKELQVSLGCGGSIPPGWIGLDINPVGDAHWWDLRLPLPFEKQSCRVILIEHVAEHLPYDDLPRLLAECFTALRPGGVIRIVSPDARIAANLLCGELGETERRHLAFERSLHRWDGQPDMVARTANRILYQWGQHLSALTPSIIADLLVRVGFREICPLQGQLTRFLPEDPGIHFTRFPDSVHESFVVEALR